MSDDNAVALVMTLSLKVIVKDFTKREISLIASALLKW